MIETMSGGFGKDLFKSTARYYEAFRPGYPETLIADLLERVSGRARLLDIACGTGQICGRLAKTFEEVLGLDQETEMIELARSLHPSVGWFTGAVENFDTDVKFDLITVGNAFHRLERNEVARRAFSWLKPGACLAILWSNGPWTENAEWQQNLAEKIERWKQRLAGGRVPRGWREDIEKDPTEAVLQREGFIYEGRYTFPITRIWTIETIVGYANSTSVLCPAVLGGHADEFATDISYLGTGPFQQRTTAAYELARKPR